MDVEAEDGEDVVGVGERLEPDEELDGEVVAAVASAAASPVAVAAVVQPSGAAGNADAEAALDVDGAALALAAAASVLGVAAVAVVHGLEVVDGHESGALEVVRIARRRLEEVAGAQVVLLYHGSLVSPF